jgi:crotonobetainyl-CoA:carnitine CoA-transferase CaiB-like acyl-CoA transferase
VTGPLEGLRVLDLTRVLAGPLCTMILGDLGAHVIKVERPGTGDDTRGWGPPFDADGQAAYFLSVNRNKLSVAADLARPEDQALIADLMDEADVVIDNFRSGVLARYGIVDEQIMNRNERLVWCTITGFGQDDPRPGYDFVVQAESGWMAITGPVEGPPSKVGVALADVITGKDAAAAVLAAVIGVDRARGVVPSAQRRITVSLAHSAVAALVNVAQNVLVTGRDAARWGNAHPNLVPYQLFEAADRALVIAVGTDPQWLALAGVLGLDDLAAEPALRTNAGRVASRDRVVSAIAARIAGRPAAHWQVALEAAGVPCGVVRTVSEALADIPASPRAGVAPATGGVVRRLPPGLDAHGALVRAHRWSAFDHVPILP